MKEFISVSGAKGGGEVVVGAGSSVVGFGFWWREGIVSLFLFLIGCKDWNLEFKRCFGGVVDMVLGSLTPAVASVEKK